MRLGKASRRWASSQEMSSTGRSSHWTRNWVWGWVRDGWFRVRRARIRAGLTGSGGMEGVEVVGFGRVGSGSWKNSFRSETWNTGWMARRGGRSRR